MKIILLITFCLLFGLTAAVAQPEKPQNLLTKVGVEEIYLAKDDGNGAAGDVAEGFLTTDIPIYCVVLLDSIKPAIVKMNFVAVSVKGVKPETKVLSVSYKTNGAQNRVNFTGKPEGVWTAGNYRIDIFVDGQSSGSKEFEIKKAFSPSVEQTNFVPPKPVSKTKPAKRPRKN